MAGRDQTGRGAASSIEQLLLDALALAWRALPEETRTVKNAAREIDRVLSSLAEDEVRVTEHSTSVANLRGQLSVDEAPVGRSVRNRPSGIERARARHANAYRQWSDDEETRLKRLFEERLPVEEIAVQLARQPGAVYSRLVKLGLIEGE